MMIYDMSGRFVMSSSKKQLDVSQLSMGVYQAIVVTNLSETSSISFVKN